MRSTPARRVAALLTTLSLLLGCGLGTPSARAAEAVVHLTPTVNPDSTVTVDAVNALGHDLTACSVWLHDDDLTPVQELASGIGLAHGQSASWRSDRVRPGFWAVVLDCAEGTGRQYVTVDIAGFADVPAESPFAQQILWLRATGLTEGFPDGTYRPTSPVHRDALAAFLHRMAGSPSVALPAVSPLRDVPSDTQFYAAMVWLDQTGISPGWNETDATRTFRPLDPVNREAMTGILYRYCHPQPGVPAFQPPETSPFRDVSTEHGSYTEIAWLAEAGLITARPDGTFGPGEPVTRAEMAALLFGLHWHLLAISRGESAPLLRTVTARP